MANKTKWSLKEAVAIEKNMKPSSPKPSDESIGEDRPLAFSITNILHHVSINSYEVDISKFS